MADDTRVGYIWLYGLIVLFALGVIELVIFPAVQNYYLPTLKVVGNNTLNSSDAAEYTAHVDETFRLINIVPYVLMGVVVIYMIVSAFKKEPYDYYGGGGF